MGVKSLGDLVDLFKELTEFKKKAPEIKILFEHFDKSENPRDSLEKILDAVKKNPVTDDLLKISQTYNMVVRAEKNAEEKGWGYACLEVVKEMGVEVKLNGEENIPFEKKGLYISNHPYGLLDSAVLIGNLYSILEKRGEKIKLIGMNQLRFIKGVEEIVHFVHTTTSSSNFGPLKNSLKYIENGGNLILCPSGTMSGANLKEYPWKNALNNFISHCSYVVPMWVSGSNHEGIYNFLARHKKTEKFRRIFSLRGAWNKKGETVYFNIGKPLSSEELLEIKDEKYRINYIRECAEALKVKI